jgi:hypothetical protein
MSLPFAVPRPTAREFVNGRKRKVRQMHRKPWIAIGALIVALALSLSLGFTPTSSAASAGQTETRRLHPGLRQGYALNWSGYAAQTSLTSPASGVVTDVKATWTVPKVTGGRSRTYSSVWVGIDGYSSPTVEQIGTEQDWTGRTGSYYAWYEMYPAGMHTIGRVYPGDTINAEVGHGGGGTFLLTITDVTHPLTYATTQVNSSALLQSAEWIAEAPSSQFGVLPLANFGTATFTAAQATFSGHAGTISDGAWVNDPMTMVTSGGTVKALPSSLTAGGSSFSVAWKHN